MADSGGLLIKVRGDGRSFVETATKAFGATAVKVEPILRVPSLPVAGGRALDAPTASTWLRINVNSLDAGNPWDRAHAFLRPDQPFAAAGRQGVEMVEPDIPQDWNYKGSGNAQTAAAGAKSIARDLAEFCRFEDQSHEGATGPGVAWNVRDEFSQLASARGRVGDKLRTILVAYLDTGFDPHHVTLAVNLRRDLQRNFVNGEGDPSDASDHTPPDRKLIANRGHGSGTLSLLAGNKLDGSSPDWGSFADYIGGAPLAQIVPVRIADWVARFTTGTMVQGFGYAHECGAHVLSMSMGGLSSQALTDAVNLAYDAGIVLVTAAGNNFANLPSPKSIVFPARFKRVLAACGVMADGRAYTDLAFGTMQGNYGPSAKMGTAIAGFTPNVPWAHIDCGNVVNMNGAGTSAATPQIAAAVALWLAEHWDSISRYSEPWMRVEAVRQALFTSALKMTARMGQTKSARNSVRE